MADTQAKKFLGNLWAEEGIRIDPSELGIDREEGWDVRYEQLGVRKFPEVRVFNQLLRELQGLYSDHMTQGILAWDSRVDYVAHAFATHDGHTWWSQVATGPSTGNSSEPGSIADIWRLY